ncbi:unnamed protein product [Brassica oleracea var. botrytis]|uniref:(rape) hypothetical protein n=1 Tax=Brassica napus TaxID=3708 RepID=A0A816I5D8_BRANA|nr:unnamed protein product [Brassica napus]
MYQILLIDILIPPLNYSLLVLLMVLFCSNMIRLFFSLVSDLMMFINLQTCLCGTMLCV